MDCSGIGIGEEIKASNAMKKKMRKGLLSILSCLSDSVEKKGQPSDPKTFMLAVLTSRIAYNI